MAQLLFVLLILFAAIGIYRCDAPSSNLTDTGPADPPVTRLESTLGQPARVQEAARQQVDMINQRNQEMLDRY